MNPYPRALCHLSEYLLDSKLQPTTWLLIFNRFVERQIAIWLTLVNSPRYLPNVLCSSDFAFWSVLGWVQAASEKSRIDWCPLLPTDTRLLQPPWRVSIRLSFGVEFVRFVIRNTKVSFVFRTLDGINISKIEYVYSLVRYSEAAKHQRVLGQK